MLLAKNFKSVAKYKQLQNSSNDRAHVNNLPFNTKLGALIFKSSNYFFMYMYLYIISEAHCDVKPENRSQAPVKSGDLW